MPAQPQDRKAAKGQTKSDKYTPTAWGGEVLEDVEVPSGQLCQCRRPGVQGLMAAKLLDKLDILTNMVNEEHINRVKGIKPTDIAEELNSPEKLMEVLETVDRVVEYIVVQPVLIRPVKVEDGTETLLTDAERLDGVVYTDMVDLEDKMFLFNYAVGGTRDVATFREEFAELMGDMGAESDVEVSSQ